MDAATPVILVIFAAVYLYIAGLVYESLIGVVPLWLLGLASLIWPLTVVFYPFFVLLVVVGRFCARSWGEWRGRGRVVGGGF